MTSIQTLEAQATTDKKVDFGVGDRVRVNVRIEEGDKSRIQAFEGTVIGIHRGGPRTTFTVRKVSHGVGVERIFPLASPTVEQVELLSTHRNRRAKLYYLRGRAGKSARLRETKDA